MSNYFSTSRNILDSFEYTETNDEFLMLIEILQEVPLLPIFGEFNRNEIKDDLAFNPYILSSAYNESGIFEEIIYERINNNYQIVKPKDHVDYYNKKFFDLKKSKIICLYLLSQLIQLNYLTGDSTMLFLLKTKITKLRFTTIATK